MACFRSRKTGRFGLPTPAFGLELVVHHYRQGASAEEIAVRFPALRLADVHACLAYYLNHEEEVHEYMTGQRQRADELQERLAADPAQQRGLAQMRQRLQTRAANKGQGAS